MPSTDFIEPRDLRADRPCYVHPSFIRCVQPIPESPGIDQHTAISTSDLMQILVYDTPDEIMELIDAAAAITKE